jgi:predicted nucleotide-binding protein
MPKRSDVVAEDSAVEEFRRRYSKLHVHLSSIWRLAIVYESDVRIYNDILETFEPFLDVTDWYVPNEFLHGRPEHLSIVGGGARANQRMMSRSKFELYAVPGFEALGRELRRLESMQQLTVSSSSSPAPDSAEVWVVYGRDEKFRKEVFRFLRDVGLKPIEFSKAIARSGSGSPSVIDVVLKEISNAPAIVCLFTPDDRAELREELRGEPGNSSDTAEVDRSKDGGYQPRPNVLLETGMALAVMRHRTVIVSHGQMRPISDLDGLHEVRWKDSPKVRADLINRLDAMGLPVDRHGVDWLS